MNWHQKFYKTENSKDLIVNKWLGNVSMFKPNKEINKEINNINNIFNNIMSTCLQSDNRPTADELVTRLEDVVTRLPSIDNFQKQYSLTKINRMCNEIIVLSNERKQLKALVREYTPKLENTVGKPRLRNLHA
eukprot:UN32671